MTQITLYGLMQCDRCRCLWKRLQLQNTQDQLRFVDWRKDGLTPEGLLRAELLDPILAVIAWKTLLNKKSTSWRELSQSDKNIDDLASARALMMRFPTLIKRPLLQIDQHFLLAKAAETYGVLSL